MKKFLGLTWEEAIEEAKEQGRSYEVHEATDFEDAWLEVSTEDGNGAALQFEDGKVEYFEYLGWM